MICKHCQELALFSLGINFHETNYESKYLFIYLFAKLLNKLALKLSEKILVHAFGVSACVTFFTFYRSKK